MDKIKEFLNKRIDFEVRSNYEKGVKIKYALVVYVAVLLLFTSLGYTLGCKTINQTKSSKSTGSEIDNDIYIDYFIGLVQEFDFDLVSNKLSKEEQILFSYFAKRYTTKYDLNIALPYIFASIESDFHLKAYNNKFGATGIFQVTPICVKEYNNVNGTNHTMDKLYDLELSFEISMWYIKRLITVYNIPPRMADLYAAYNAGPTAYRNNRNWSERRFHNRYNEINAIFVANE